MLAPLNLTPKMQLTNIQNDIVSMTQVIKVLSNSIHKMDKLDKIDEIEAYQNLSTTIINNMVANL